MSPSFGQRVRGLRRGAHVTQRELAAALGIDHTYLSKLENDRCLPPSAKLIKAMARELATDAEALLLLGDKPPVSVLRRQVREVRECRESWQVECGRLLAIIISLQWSGGLEETELCLLCDQSRESGHSPDCPIGAALERAGQRGR